MNSTGEGEQCKVGSALGEGRQENSVLSVNLDLEPEIVLEENVSMAAAAHEYKMQIENLEMNFYEQEVDRMDILQ